MDMIGAEDAEWEYEYAEEDTEDFYVVLELPDASALKPKSKADELFAAHDPTKTRKKAPHAGKKRRRGAEPEDENENEEEDEAPAAALAENNGDDESATVSQPRLIRDLEHLNLAAAAAVKQSDGATEPKGLQIMDLATDQPMIMYQGQIYNCEWASSIGTDLLFVRRPEEPSPGYEPLHSFKEVDILGIGAAKLIASPATIERRQDFTRQSNLDAPLPDSSVMALDEEVVRQARFLGRIAEIKASKGEQVGNLKTLADSVFRNPEEYFGPDGRPFKRGRGGRGSRARGSAARRRGRAAANTATASIETPTIATTRTRRASTQSNSGSQATPVTWADLEDDDNAER